jgi:hypothetical protein
MAEITDETIQAALADESTPKPLRDAYNAMRQDLEAARAEVATGKREAAFAKAGLSDLPHRELFERSYDGDLTPEAIREAASPYGLVTGTTDAAAAASRELAEATRQVQAGTSTTTQPQADDAMAALNRAGNNPEAIKAVIQKYGPDLGVGLPASVGGYRLV